MEVKMAFNWFKRKDPMCGMREEKGKGTEKDGNWFCSEKCVKEFVKNNSTKHKGSSCCCGH